MQCNDLLLAGILHQQAAPAEVQKGSVTDESIILLEVTPSRCMHVSGGGVLHTLIGMMDGGDGHPRQARWPETSSHHFNFLKSTTFTALTSPGTLGCKPSYSEKIRSSPEPALFTTSRIPEAKKIIVGYGCSG